VCHRPELNWMGNQPTPKRCWCPEPRCASMSAIAVTTERPSNCEGEGLVNIQDLRRWEVQPGASRLPLNHGCSETNPSICWEDVQSEVSEWELQQVGKGREEDQRVCG